MNDAQLAESIAKALDFNLAQIFNEIDLKVKKITHAKAEQVAVMLPAKPETKILILSEFKSTNGKITTVISFNKQNALKMVDLIKGADFGATKLFSEKEVEALKSVSSNLCKACVNSIESVTGIKGQTLEPEVVFSFSSFENEFVKGTLSGKGMFFELTLSVGGTDIKGEMKFFVPEAMVK